MENKIYRRGFLNPGKGIAAYEIKGEVGHGAKWASLKLTDCNRQITLEFDVDQPKDLGARLKKIDLLMVALQDLRDFLVGEKPDAA